MNSDRLRELQDVCERALARPVGQRAAFLEEACAGDSNLRLEVESLLSEQSAAGSFLEHSALAAWRDGRSSLSEVVDMSMPAGTMLGPYEILRCIGVGGMGRVYEARDTRLGRSLAIKLLPPAFNADPERRSRFEREARTVAALAHPHICTIHDLGVCDEADGAPGAMYLVMEYLRGETLGERLRKGPLPITDALEIGAQVAGALSAAHRHGIVHRDLKPANVMLTRSGAKLLDFGIAKVAQQAVGAPMTPGGDALAAGSQPLTAEGTMLGTLQYMAPEQIEGGPIDPRTDIFALGLILYEMLTGRPAFDGPDSASIMTALLQQEPPAPSALRPTTPAPVDALVRRCLARSPEDRPDTANDVRNDLLWMQQVGEPTATARGALNRMRARIQVVLAAIVCAGAAVASGWYLKGWLRSPRPAPVVRSELNVRPAEELNGGGVAPVYIPTAGGARTSLAWTADGRSLVFVGREHGVQRLYVRSIYADVARALQGTEGAQVPDVSTDGNWVAFWAAEAVRKVPLDGGPVVELASRIGMAPLAMVWGADGRLFCSGADGTVRQIADGGAVTALSAGLDAEAQIVSSMLPGNRGLLYTSRTREFTWGDEEVVVLNLETRTPKVLLHDAADARYVPTGHLVFLRRGVLWAVAFDLDRLETAGPEVPLQEGVAQALTSGNSNDVTGAGQFAVSATGALAWIPGSPPSGIGSVPVVVDRQGRSSPIPVEGHPWFETIQLSPDGRKLALVTWTTTAFGLWVYDFQDRRLTPLRQGGEITWPRWSADSRRILFSSLERGKYVIRSESADGAGTTQVLSPGPFVPSSWLPGGEVIGVTSRKLARLAPGGKVARLDGFNEERTASAWPEMSPDGRWLAYGLSTGGRWEVYVRQYPGPGVRALVSVSGGTNPVWIASGGELLYVDLPDKAGRQRMMSVSFAAGAPPRLGTPTPLFEFDPNMFAFGCTPARCFDVSHDGQRFFVFRGTPPPPPVVTHVNLVQNWFEELKARVPRDR